jgi:hypothetical protein
MGTPLYTLFTCTVDDCFNIDSKETTRIYKRENIHCLKLPPESWALDERQSKTILHKTVETKVLRINAILHSRDVYIQDQK